MWGEFHVSAPAGSCLRRNRRLTSQGGAVARGAQHERSGDDEPVRYGTLTSNHGLSPLRATSIPTAETRRWQLARAEPGHRLTVGQTDCAFAAMNVSFPSMI